MREQERTMSDAEDWQTMRTASAGKNARRFHANKRGYTIYMDRLGVDIHVGNVHWVDEPVPLREMSEPLTAVGVYLGEYHIDLDNNPNWHAVVTIDRPAVTNGDVRITGVTITGDALETSALPFAEILRCVFSVGGVVGTFRTERGTKPGVLWHLYKIEIGADGQSIHPDEVASLRGYKERPGRHSPAYFQMVIHALQEHAELKTTHKTFLTQREFVAKRTGYSESNIQKDITAARSWAAKQNKTKRNTK
jgi:hypothetical protein